MFQAISDLFASFARLASAVNRLAETTETANESIRERIGYAEPAVIEHKPIRNGRQKA
jgi:hypothetical protein